MFPAVEKDTRERQGKLASGVVLAHPLELRRHIPAESVQKASIAMKILILHASGSQSWVSLVRPAGQDREWMAIDGHSHCP